MENAWKTCQRCTSLSDGHEPGKYRCIAHRVIKPEVICSIEIVSEDWGKILGKMIFRTETRVASYKKIVQTVYQTTKDRELINLFKEFEHDEEKFLKKLRKEKTAWNEGECST